MIGTPVRVRCSSVPDELQDGPWDEILLPRRVQKFTKRDAEKFAAKKWEEGDLEDDNGQVYVEAQWQGGFDGRAVFRVELNLKAICRAYDITEEVPEACEVAL